MKSINSLTILVINYKLWRKLRKTALFVYSHKQCKTLLKYNMVRFKIISLYIYKDLRLEFEYQLNIAKTITYPIQATYT